MHRTAAYIVSIALLPGSFAFGQSAPSVPATPVQVTPATPASTTGGQAKGKPALYDEKADTREQIAAALAKAKKENRRVLIQWGGNWCGWCIRMNELMTSDSEIARTLMYEYDVVHADAGRNNKNADLMAQYGADAMKQGFPYLTILDANGKPVANQETGSLEVKDAKGETSEKAGHDRAKVLAFLKANAASPVKAQDTLAAGLAQAKSSGRSVFLHFGAPWCGWCHRLEDWMARPEIAALLAKDFVDVKVDVDRAIGGKEMLARYRGPKDSGIPWFVFLDADGKALVTSEGPKGNTGFPASPEEIEHFAAMLAKARKTTTEADSKAVIDSLKAEKH